MKKHMWVLLTVLLVFVLIGCGKDVKQNRDAESGENITNHTQQAADTTETGLSMSDWYITIRAEEKEAVFQLYDTSAAEKLYEQLPLTLETSNFGDAQWMFYPPEKLPVTAEEAYHDGIKGELSYYEPWGDVFILYEDFHAGDEMHRLGVCVSGSEYLGDFGETITVEKRKPDQADGSKKSQEAEEVKKQMKVTTNGQEILFELNDSAAASSLYDQLPFEVEVSDYSNDEKIFYPPESLDTSGTPSANAKSGTLAYFEPWGDVVMFYREFGKYSGLYELGQAVAGDGYIESIPKGTYRFEKVTDD